MALRKEASASAERSRRERQQGLTPEPMQLGLEPALLEAFDPRQRVVDQPSASVGSSCLHVDAGQQTEQAGMCCCTPEPAAPPSLGASGRCPARSRRRRRPPSREGSSRSPTRPRRPCSAASVIIASARSRTHPRPAADLMEPAGQVQSLARREGVAQLVRGGERLLAARQGSVRIALPQQDQGHETEARHTDVGPRQVLDGGPVGRIVEGESLLEVRQGRGQPTVEQQAEAEDLMACGPHVGMPLPLGRSAAAPPRS